MALSMTLSKTQNHMYEDYPDAYWVIEDINYNLEFVAGYLRCYPTRECSKKNGHQIEEWSQIPFGGPAFSSYNNMLWKWEFMARITDVFPNGIPLSSDEQKTAIYNWIKTYTNLPFEDVFEE